jgi:hypothetical protein
VRGDLDRLLLHDAGLGLTRLTWLTTPAVEATSAAVKTATLNTSARIRDGRRGGAYRTSGGRARYCMLLAMASRA